MTTNPIDNAVSIWNDGSASMFEFCIEAAYIVGRRVEGETKTLAKRIKRSVDTVERYAKVGVLWFAVLEKYPADSESIREELDYQYWQALALLWSRNIISLAGVKHWFDEAIVNKWDYEKFSSMLPTKKALDSDWQKLAHRTAVMIDDLCKSPAFGVDDVRYRAGVRILQVASIWLKGMTMKNIIDLLIDEKIADNDFRASHIANGCRLMDLKTDEEKLERARLYRDWRNSGAYHKSDTASCFAKAIEGAAAPAALIQEVLHTKGE
jgi:hypothetical protein